MNQQEERLLRAREITRARTREAERKLLEFGFDAEEIQQLGPICRRTLASSIEGEIDMLETRFAPDRDWILREVVDSVQDVLPTRVKAVPPLSPSQLGQRLFDEDGVGIVHKVVAGVGASLRAVYVGRRSKQQAA